MKFLWMWDVGWNVNGESNVIQARQGSLKDVIWSRCYVFSLFVVFEYLSY